MRFRWRFNFVFLLFLVLAGLILGRLVYWQLVMGERLALVAKNQYWSLLEIPAARGKILARDGFPLVDNQPAYLVFALPKEIKEIKSLAGWLAERLSEDEEVVKERLQRQDLNWVPLKHRVSPEIKEELVAQKIAGLGFTEETARYYPEGSIAAQLLGFVGLDAQGRDQGYFGLEGKYDLELRGKNGFLGREKDALNRPILLGETKEEKSKNGRDLLTAIDRGVQFLLEERLSSGIKKYDAKSGAVIVMVPQTGEILGMASRPSYDPATYPNFDQNLYSNPVVASAFEPGSIFKVLVMAAAIDAGVVEPETRCTRCAGPREIGGYTIETWNKKYSPESTITEIIQHSDNIGMVFVGEELGKDKLLTYLKKFGLGELTGIDLQDEATPKLRPDNQWKMIDLATASFGQGIAVTPVQMIQAVGALANGGKLMRPFVVKEVFRENGGGKEIKSVEVRQVVKPETAKIITEMMVNAVEQGEAKWARLKGYRIAGKTGTAQVAVAGHYDEKKTIASFVGFAPADKPKFVMLVTLQEPTSSLWGSETAAPLWFEIAKELFTYYGILPQ